MLLLDAAGCHNVVHYMGRLKEKEGHRIRKRFIIFVVDNMKSRCACPQDSPMIF